MVLEWLKRRRNRLQEAEPETEDKADPELDRAIRSASGKKILITRENIARFGDLTGDFNPAHRDIEYAKKLGLPDVVSIGAYTAMLAEQEAKLISARIKDLYGDEGIRLRGMEIKFPKQVHPGETLEFRVGTFKEGSEGSLEISMTGMAGDKEVARVVAKLDNRFGIMPTIAAPIIQYPSEKLWTITQEALKGIYELLEVEQRDELPLMLHPALIPRSMLAYLKRKTGEMNGLNASMDFTFLDVPSLGQVQVDLYKPQRVSSTPRGGAYTYRMRALCGQTANSMPTAYGEIFVFSPKELDFTPSVEEKAEEKTPEPNSTP